jgi:hypothetical protein
MMFLGFKFAALMVLATIGLAFTAVFAGDRHCWRDSYRDRREAAYGLRESGQEIRRSMREAREEARRAAEEARDELRRSRSEVRDELRRAMRDLHESLRDAWR